VAAKHPDVIALMQSMKTAGRPFEELTPDEARAAYSAGRAALQPPPDPVREIQDLTAPGEGGPIPLRVYRGAGTEAEDRPPCLLYLHGGGWVLGDIASHDGICRRLANVTQACVVAVDYRRAPEHPYPAAVRDAASALTYVAAEARRLRIDPMRLAVGGDSAGGNLAAVLAKNPLGAPFDPEEMLADYENGAPLSELLRMPRWPEGRTPGHIIQEMGLGPLPV
jgi:acetyl esterase